MSVTMNHLLDNRLCETVGVSSALSHKIESFTKRLFTGVTFELATIQLEKSGSVTDTQITCQPKMVLMNVVAFLVAAWTNCPGEHVTFAMSRNA
jgi:hypothetical protein